MSPDSDSTRLPNPNLCAEQRAGRSPETAAGAFSRRRFIARNMQYFSALVATPWLVAFSDASRAAEVSAGCGLQVSNLTNLGPLLEPDENGVRLPAGFTSRVIARAANPVVPGSGFAWHGSPDGGACYADGDGWIYVSNCELVSSLGGASAVRFDANGNIVDAYPILAGTSGNCAGGATPWGTWLSCEESGDSGRVFECDPHGVQPAIERPALGRFNHEAVAYHESTHTLYLTEDRTDGRFYRFTPDTLTGAGFADLSAGTLAVAQVIVEQGVNTVVWHDLPDPLGLAQPTRRQVPWSTPFNGGEGIVAFGDRIAFTTKGDNRVWSYTVATQTLAITYDEASNANPILSGVDNIAVNFAGEYLVAEDNGDMQLVVLSPAGVVLPLLQLVGHDDSEITGPAFSPDGTRLYFSSQRGTSGSALDGITYEVTGPFFSIL
jgi:DNA-binding beta-propeller fold protein YncE